MLTRVLWIWEAVQAGRLVSKNRMSAIALVTKAAIAITQLVILVQREGFGAGAPGAFCMDMPLSRHRSERVT
jgi:hypothetical protein